MSSVCDAPSPSSSEARICTGCGSRFIPPIRTGRGRPRTRCEFCTDAREPDQEPGPPPKKRLSEAHREAISRGQRERHARNHVLAPPLPETTKRCSKCGHVKKVNLIDASASDFPIRTRKLVSGERRRYPAGECKMCNNKRAADWRQKLRDEGRLAAEQARWNQNRDAEHRRRYQREYQRMQRVEQGVTPRGPWKRYRNETNSPVVYVSADPFLDWLDEAMAIQGMTDLALAEKVGVDPRVLYRLRHENKRRRIDLALADSLAVAMGMPQIVAVLFPDTAPAVL
jgi:hypothetical protein